MTNPQSRYDRDYIAVLYFPHASSNYEILVFLCSSFQFVIGNVSNMSDFAYVENVAHANICADQALSSNAASVAGKVHF